MSKISGRETKPEILVRKYLFSQGHRFRKNDKRLPGKPDIVLRKYKTVIFVHGCFWHGHNCNAGKLPETRKEFWEIKIGATKKRDQSKELELSEKGWKVITVWECELRNRTIKEDRLHFLIEQIASSVLQE